MAKIFYALIAVTFCLATTSLWSQAAISVPSKSISTNQNAGIEFKYLNKLQSGLAASWVVYSDDDVIKGAKRKQRYYWVGTFDAFTFTSSSVTTSKEGKVVESYTDVWGRRNGTRWQATSYEEGIVDVNTHPTKQIIQTDNALSYPLTNVLTMGFGLDWDVNSMRFLANDKVTGKAANSPDSLEGQITYLTNGQVKQFFYSSPSQDQSSEDKSYLLKISYRTEQDQFPSGFELWHAFLLPNGEPYPALLDEKCEILSISDITPDEAKLAGVPSPSLSENALISNGVTYARSPRALTPEVIGAVRSNPTPPASNSNKSKPAKVRTIIFAIFFPLLLVVAFVIFKKWRSK